MLKAKSNNSEKNIIVNSDLTPTVTNFTAGAIPIVLVKGKGVAQIRCAGYATSAIPNDTAITWNLGISPKTALAGLRYWRTSSSGFELSMTTQGVLTIKPFGGEIAKGGGVYFNEVVLID